MSPTIGTIIIAYNEEANIGRCIKSVQGFSDEVVVVVDPKSVDQTESVAAKLGVTIYKRAFDSMDRQKTFAESKLTTDWVFSLDADETATPELAEEVKTVIQNKEFDGYLIPRRNIILGKEIKHTRWSPDKHIWLWKRGIGKWTPGVHAEVEIEGMAGHLKHAKMHYQYQTVREFLDMINSYTDAEAKEMIGRGIKFSWFRLFYAPILSFFRRYIYKHGFLDGWRGFILSYLMAYHRMMTWVKIWEKEKITLNKSIDLQYRYEMARKK